jgi:DNA invertase Pin-like site-specific DNA recombinase
MEEFMKIGYLRVSKNEQNEVLQIDALKEVDCDKWFVDKSLDQKQSARA